MSRAPRSLFSWNGPEAAERCRCPKILERGKPSSFDFRFGGNERFQKHFRSGCIICDYSCPGGAIGNRNRTIREEVKLGVIFTANERRVPKDGTEVMVIFRPPVSP